MLVPTNDPGILVAPSGSISLGPTCRIGHARPAPVHTCQNTTATQDGKTRRCYSRHFATAFVMSISKILSSMALRKEGLHVCRTQERSRSNHPGKLHSKDPKARIPHCMLYAPPLRPWAGPDPNK
eukprot:2664701-Rhodomonas_salina.3